MFFDPKWRSRQDALTRKSLIAWLEKQAAGDAYPFISCTSCMFARYLRVCGFKRVKVEAGEFEHAESFGPVKLPKAFIQIAALRPHTYGAALERARGR